MRTANRSRRSIPPRSAFAGFCFPPDVIVLAVRWYLRFGLSTATSKSSWLSGALSSTSSAATAGCSGSRRCSPRPPGPAGTPSETAGRVYESGA
jgi:hypothetical protein